METHTQGGHSDPLQHSCLENPNEQGSLVGDSPWGHKESDTTERLSTAHSTANTHTHTQVHVKLMKSE